MCCGNVLGGVQMLTVHHWCVVQHGTQVNVSTHLCHTCEGGRFVFHNVVLQLIFLKYKPAQTQRCGQDDPLQMDMGEPKREPSA
jgi:hypothetical protein